jgi:ketosteroid isomerase-like protein
MGKPREIMDKVTDAMVEQRDLDAVLSHYTDDAMIITPDAGEIRGRNRIAEYWRPFIEAFPDGHYEVLRKHEAGDCAIDEGWLVATHNGPFRLPDGEVIEPTGRPVRMRSCDIATVVGDKIREHHMYFDQMEFLGQLGLTPVE